MTLPLPSQALAWLKHAADAGQCDAQVMLHLIARADKRDNDVAVFVDSYSSTITALCRRLEALERGASDRSIADTPAEDAPVDAGPVAAALIEAKSALGDVAEGEAVSPRAVLKAEPQAERPSEKDLYDLAAEFNGDPVPAMRRALELWGNPLQGAPAPGENLATPSAPEVGEVAE
jgi:hypothetical protein